MIRFRMNYNIHRMIMTSNVLLLFLQDIQVYKYYRDLINFKTRGNPVLMLRCINPQEAKLLDAAAGVHIKFRLAGVSSCWSYDWICFMVEFYLIFVNTMEEKRAYSYFCSITLLKDHPKVTSTLLLRPYRHGLVFYFSLYISTR